MTPQRPLFWSIEHRWLFYTLAAIASAIFLVGMARRIRGWLRHSRLASNDQTRKTPIKASLSNLLLDGLLGRRIFRGGKASGLMHLLIMWGFLGLFAATVLSGLDHYGVSFLNGRVYLVYSTGADIAGVMLLVGILWALVRRYVQRKERLERRAADLLIPLWLMAVGVSGFLVEAARLAITRPPWQAWSFTGWATSSWLWAEAPDGTVTYPVIWWIHALLSLGLIAVIPFSRLLHVLAAPVSIYLADHPATPVSRDEDGNREGGIANLWSLKEKVFLDACTSCGRCVRKCPSSRAGEPFSPRALIVATRDQVHHPPSSPAEIVPEGSPSPWFCTTCRACLEACPVYVDTPEVVVELRRRLVEDGTAITPQLSQTFDKLYKYQNPWEASKKKRGKWPGDLTVTDLTKRKGAAEPGQPEPVCYFVGCSTAIDTRAQQLARCFAKNLQRADVPFGTLGKKEPCCGDIARRLGEDGLFEEQLESCHRLFDKSSVTDIVASSPHCFHTLKGERPESAEPLTVRHYSELLAELVDDGKLSFHQPVHRKVTFHDPCYLGRYNDLYDPAREVIRAIDGVELVEMEHHHDKSLCCGGGGGRMWQEELDEDVKMSERRIQEAAATGAEAVITACPLCLIMLADACKTAGLEDQLEVMDLNELVQLALEPTE